MAPPAFHHQRPHVLVFPFPVQGHILPLMHFSSLLARHGCLVSFLNTEQNHLRITNSARQQQPTPDDAGILPHQDIRLLWLPDPPPSSPPNSSPASLDVVQNHIRLTQAFLDTDAAALKLLITTQDPPVTCFVVDFSAAFLINNALAQELGAPRFVIFTASAASFYMASLACKVNGDAHLMTSIPGAPPLRVSDVNTFLSVDNSPKDFMFKFFTLSFREGLLTNATILLNTFEFLEPLPLEHFRKEYEILPIGPILPPSFVGGSSDGRERSATLWKEDFNCLKWLDGQPDNSVLFVSFGSLASLSSEQLVELALGLEASHQRILWVTRPDLIYGKAPDLPKDFLDRTKERLAVVPWVPQLHVLQHPAVGGFLTHCGWNSTLESVSTGVPMICWPFFGDQMLNCRFVVDTWGIGLSLEAEDTGYIHRTEVQTKVKELMDTERGRELSERAKQLKDEAIRGLKESGSSYQNVDRVIKAASRN